MAVLWCIPKNFSEPKITVNCPERGRINNKTATEPIGIILFTTIPPPSFESGKSGPNFFLQMKNLVLILSHPKYSRIIQNEKKNKPVMNHARTSGIIYKVTTNGQTF